MEEFQRLGVHAVDMEIASCAEICQRFGVPIFGIKIIVNPVSLSKEATDDFYTNNEACVNQLAKQVGLFIPRMFTDSD